MGTNLSKKSTSKDKSVESHMSKLDNQFEDLVARKDKLREIVANINTTDENASLLNSILSMKSYKIRKFSAKQDPNRNKGNYIDLTYDRNIVNKPSREDISTSSGNLKGKNITTTNGITTDNRPPIIIANIPTRENQPKPGNTNSRKESPNIRMVETSNRFVLLNQDNQVIEGEGVTEDINGTANNVQEERNDGWRRKQERTVNAKFRDMVTQDQRYMVKRYILDNLVPLDSTISEWSKPLLDYFRHLCSIYDFGEGTIVVSRESLNELDSQNMELDFGEEEPGEVASETDGTADLMRTDAPSLGKSMIDTDTCVGSTPHIQLTDVMVSAFGNSESH
ncbi:hypothetical protein L1987_32371 [Smallanthus sonchifolius]|uniref:Uncharacterized protein n=1 Tax=Smallanthus sonchifolius TaxID=185202 RepID=A0ACB9HNQ6_9ASTR|nr:hypothetical protein L1987_32371 [Smallanthus sonchifolius]